MISDSFNKLLTESILSNLSYKLSLKKIAIRIGMYKINNKNSHNQQVISDRNKTYFQYQIMYHQNKIMRHHNQMDH